MKLDEVVAALEAAGSAQAAKIYRRHGAGDPLFGVSYAALDKLQRAIKVDHALALALWDTGNHDARILASKVVDSTRLTARQANAWMRAVDNYMTAGAVADVVANSLVARARSDAWRDRNDEWVASAGWGVVIRTCEKADVWSTVELRALLRQIEVEIHDRPNRVRHEMNMVVIAISLRDGNLQRQAMATARRIGPVDVDHGDTNCTTPEAVAYIERAVEHRNRHSRTAS